MITLISNGLLGRFGIRSNMFIVSRETSRSINRPVRGYQLVQICFYCCYLWVALCIDALCFLYIVFTGNRNFLSGH